jgi:hypothetical protein
MASRIGKTVCPAHVIMNVAAFMGKRFVPVFASRVLAAALILVMAAGAYPAPAGFEAVCQGCVSTVRDVTETSKATGHSCCHGEHPSGGLAELSSAPADERCGGCPLPCQQCCLSPGRAPVVTAAIVTLHPPINLAFDLSLPNTSQPRSGVHSSVFHPPRA